MNKPIELSLVQRGMHLLDSYGGFVGLAVVLVAVFILAFSK